MQASQRVESNQALEFAIKQANEWKQPLIVYFGLTDTFLEANERHYYFMLEGLNDVKKALYSRGICMAIKRVSPEIGAVNFTKRATLVVCNRGYLKIQKRWRQYVAEHIECPLFQVESDVLVPVEVAPPKEEYSAATLRRKLLPTLYQYLNLFPEETPLIDSSKLEIDSYDFSDIAKTISELSIDHSVKPVTTFRGGTTEVKKRLERFISNKLDRYDSLRNDPNEDCLSDLSPYIHFGQISPLYVAHQVSQQSNPDRDAYLEELVVRRELSMNFVNYNKQYDSFAGLPD
jgi:deoxyribodipyrimidine photo-lyase